MLGDAPFPDSRPGLSPSRPAGGGGIRGALPPWRGRSRPGRAGDAGWHRPAPGQPLLPCRAGSGGMEGPGGKGWGCRGERAVLALSRAELGRNWLALSGKGGKETLTPLLGASFGVQGITPFLVITGAGFQCSGNLGFLCCGDPIYG